MWIGGVWEWVGRCGRIGIVLVLGVGLGLNISKLGLVGVVVLYIGSPRLIVEILCGPLAHWDESSRIPCSPFHYLVCCIKRFMGTVIRPIELTARLLV